MAQWASLSLNLLGLERRRWQLPWPMLQKGADMPSVSYTHLDVYKRQGLIDDLPVHFKDLVFTRLNYPSATLREIGQLLPKPVSKSTVEYRWNKLENMINGLFDGGTNVLQAKS